MGIYSHVHKPNRRTVGCHNYSYNSLLNLHISGRKTQHQNLKPGPYYRQHKSLPLEVDPIEIIFSKSSFPYTEMHLSSEQSSVYDFKLL